MGRDKVTGGREGGRGTTVKVSKKIKNPKLRKQPRSGGRGPKARSAVDPADGEINNKNNNKGRKRRQGPPAEAAVKSAKRSKRENSADRNEAEVSEEKSAKKAGKKFAKKSEGAKKITGSRKQEKITLFSMCGYFLVFTYRA